MSALLFYRHKDCCARRLDGAHPSILLGWLRPMAPLISGLYALVSLAIAVASLFSSIQNHLDAYGVPIVIFRWTNSKGIDSIIFDLGIAAFPLSAAYAHIMVMMGVAFP